MAATTWLSQRDSNGGRLVGRGVGDRRAWVGMGTPGSREGRSRYLGQGADQVVVGRPDTDERVPAARRQRA